MAARQAAAAAPNPFAGVPTFDFRLDFRPEKMAMGFSRLIRELQAAVATQSKRENNGQVKAVTHPHGHYQVLLTPDGGFFALLLWPPPDAVDKDNAAVPVKLLFSLRNLYLLGFEHENIYYVFHDANLGPGIDIDTNRRMRFKGSYRKKLFEQVCIAVSDLLQTYLTLLNMDGHTPDDEIYKALYRIMVTVSEALRFLDWLRELMFIYMQNRSNPTVVTFSYHFLNWSNRSRAVRDGEAAFEGPKYGFDTYNALLSCSGISLSG